MILKSFVSLHQVAGFDWSMKYPLDGSTSDFTIFYGFQNYRI
jgi:hypothetical protein